MTEWIGKVLNYKKQAYIGYRCAVSINMARWLWQIDNDESIFWVFAGCFHLHYLKKVSQ